MTATVDGERVWRELETLASFSDAPAPAVTRVVFGEMDLRARDYIKALCARGIARRARRPGREHLRAVDLDVIPHCPPVATGSHCDAIPNAGRFDGTVGVLGGLEAIRALQRAGCQPRRSIDLVLFTSEEPTRFGIGCLGSRLLAAALDPSVGDTLTSEGRSLNKIRASAGFSGSLHDVPLRSDAYAAFVELHIEQGPDPRTSADSTSASSPRLPRPRACGSVIEGEGGHAGAVLMPDRHDAFLAAAEIALAVEAARALDADRSIRSPRRSLRAVSRARSTACRAGRGSRSTSATSIRRGAIRVLAKIAPSQRRGRGAPRRHRSQRANQRGSAGALRAADRRRDRQRVRRTRAALSADDQPRVSRLAVHVADCPDRHDLHPVPRRHQPSAGRIRVAGRDRSRHCRVWPTRSLRSG